MSAEQTEAGRLLAAFLAGKDAANSTVTPLSAGEEFPGEFVLNDDEHLAFNVLADQEGDLFVEFSIDGTTALETLSKRYEIFPNEPDFDGLVKMAGRWHRVRFVNGDTPQTKFGLLTSTGNNLYPYAKSDRDTPYLMVFAFSGLTTTTHYMMVDLSDRETYPHRNRGRIDLYATYFEGNRTNNGAGSVAIGVITRVDGTSADVSYVQGLPLSASDTRDVSRDRPYNYPIRLGQQDGTLTRVGAAIVTGITAINTGGTLVGRYGNVTPAVGDLVLTVTVNAGTIGGSASIQYLTESSTT